VSIHNPVPEFITYKVSPTSKVTAKVIIGDAQLGGWSISLGGTLLAKGADETPVEVATGAQLAGKILQVVVTVVDIQQETNRLSATVTISGGTAGDVPVTQTYDQGADGDTAILTTLVLFQ